MRMYFLDSTEEKKYEYNQVEFARFHNQIIGTGVSNPDALKVTAKTNMDVALALGWIFANGYGAELEETETLTHDVADPDNDRIDRVVIRFDTNPEKNDFYPTIIKGTPARSPVPPKITREEYIHDMSVAQVRIIAGKSHIEQYQISDERANDEVCGYIPLHNMYRGMQINELGMVTMPNQSFIKAEDKSGFKIPASLSLPGTPLPFGDIIEDRQREVDGINSFIAKSDGVYNYWVEINFETDLAAIGSEMHIYAFVNGKESFPLGTKVISHKRDHFFVANGFDSLNKGDKTEFRVTTYRSDGVELPTTFIRIRVAKLA